MSQDPEAPGSQSAEGSPDALLDTGVYSPREIYVAGMAIEAPSGCVVVDVTRLPVQTADERRHLVECYLIGAAEGTIPMDKVRLKALELAAKALGMFVNRSVHIEARGRLEDKTLEELLSPRGSRHTLRSTTVLDVEQAKRRSLIPGADTEDKLQ